MQDNNNSLCSEMSVALDEPMLGTAPQTDFWLMLEVRDRWEAKNLIDNQLPDAVQNWLQNFESTAQNAGWYPRIQFIRGRQAKDAPLNLMTCKDGELRTKLLDTIDEVTELNLLEEELDLAREEAMYFVCAHGSRDVCCSRFGLETWRRLNEKTDSPVWQTTHLGGHRFAPNVLHLPTGQMYGRVFADRVEEFVQTLESGEIAWEFSRGNCTLPKPVQVCEPYMLEKGAEFIKLTDSHIELETMDGMELIPTPKEKTMQVLTSCKDQEASTVTYYSR